MKRKIIWKTKEELLRLLEDGIAYEFKPQRFKDIEKEADGTEYRIKEKIKRMRGGYYL